MALKALGRVLRTGLSSLRDRAAARLAALRFNPSRKLSRIKSIRLEGTGRNVSVVAEFFGDAEQVVIQTFVPDQTFRVSGAVFPPFERQ